MTTQQILNNLIAFRCQGKPSTFVEIFGQRMGAHLWQEFKGRHDDRDLLRLIGTLDSINAPKFAAWIERDLVSCLTCHTVTAEPVQIDAGPVCQRCYNEINQLDPIFCGCGKLLTQAENIAEQECLECSGKAFVEFELKGIPQPTV